MGVTLCHSQLHLRRNCFVSYLVVTLKIAAELAMHIVNCGNGVMHSHYHIYKFNYVYVDCVHCKLKLSINFVTKNFNPEITQITQKSTDCKTFFQALIIW